MNLASSFLVSLDPLTNYAKIGTNLLTKFHYDLTINVASTMRASLMLTTDDRQKAITKSHLEHAKNAPPTGGHVFSTNPTIFELVRDINKTNVLTTFHDDWAKIVTSRVFTRENCHYIHIEKNAPPTGGHVFSPISTIFELAKIVTSRMKTALPTGGHVFQRIGTNFELNQDIIKTNIFTNFELGQEFFGTKLLTKFHEDGTRNVA
ncbi:hypothetical protein DPMN_051577 [Dreissena polymorpha]|uniref:Uncharacterized protein n=1 Tax=Dreissena polymorpha TaxID=45954 RepID=A0A9D4HQE7_DREPO|nr:hypothetical protein DPMN_051577 [Dreissena polymorpha]